MSYFPLMYDQINISAGTYTPPNFRYRDNASYNFWERALFQRAMSVISIKNLPEHWRGNNKDFLFYCLFKFGYVACFKNDKFDIAFQPCGLSGYDFYYQPTTANISNPALRIDLTIHKECEILKVAPDFMGIWDIIDRYAIKLSNLDPAIDMAILNSRYATIMGSDTKAGVKFLEKVVDLVNSGKPAIVFDSSILIPQDPVTKEDTIKDYSRDNIKNTYIGTELLQDMATVLNDFDTEIGIPTIPYQKKERMVEDEANSKIIDSTSRSLVWVDTLNECFVLINKLLSTDMIAVHNYASQMTGGGNNE